MDHSTDTPVDQSPTERDDSRLLAKLALLDDDQLAVVVAWVDARLAAAEEEAQLGDRIDAVTAKIERLVERVSDLASDSD